MPILVYLEVTVALHADVAFSVNGYHRYLSQHICHRERLRFPVGLHVVAYAVYLLLNQLALGLYLDSFQFFVPRHRVVAAYAIILGHSYPRFRHHEERKYAGFQYVHTRVIS